MLQPILDRRQTDLLTAERRLLADLRVVLARLEATEEDQDRLAQSVAQLDELFLLVVVGEFNAGKSAFINALLGQRLLDEGVTPTTTRIHLIGYGPEVERRVAESGIEVLTAPVELLREINLVDTPGTNAIDRRHEALTTEFVPRSDLVIFVTSADRPFTESERTFLERIRKWGKKVVVVVNKIDILNDDDDVARIEGFIADNARSLLGFVPEIFPVSAKLALEGKETERPEAVTTARLESLEHFIADRLDDAERIRLKLLNPLGVGLRLLSEQRNACQKRLSLLQDDLSALEEIERQLAVYRQDLQREFRFRVGDVEKHLHEFENRGVAFFDETLRLPRIVDLLNKARIQADFERRVVADLPARIEAQVSDLIDWMVRSELRQWQAVTEHIERRRAEHAQRIVGRVGGAFDSHRSQLLETVGRAARRSVDDYDREHEARRLAESVQLAVAGAAILEAGAIGLGTALTLLATTTAADVTGILAAGTLATLGLFVIPARRQQAKRRLRERIAKLKAQLIDGLTAEFEREMGRSVSRIHEAVAPYTRFVRAERQRLQGGVDELDRIDKQLAKLRAEVEEL